MSDGSLISSRALRFSTTLRRNLQAPDDDPARRVHPLPALSFFLHLFFYRAPPPGVDSDNPRHRSLSFRVQRSRLRFPPSTTTGVPISLRRDQWRNNAEPSRINLPRDWREAAGLHRASVCNRSFETFEEERERISLTDIRRTHKERNSISCWRVYMERISSIIASDFNGRSFDQFEIDFSRTNMSTDSSFFDYRLVKESER